MKQDKDKTILNLDYAIRCIESCKCAPNQSSKNEIISYFLDARKTIKELRIHNEELKQELGEFKVSFYDNIMKK